MNASDSDFVMIHPPFAVIFDMNGVIIDDLPYHRKAFEVFAERHQRPITEAEFANELNGRMNSEILSYLFDGKLSEAEILKLEVEKESLYREIYREKREVLPGLPAFLEALKDAGVPLAVATSAPPENVSFILDDLDLRKYFRAVVDASRVARGKPHPDIYLLAAKELGMAPERCLVFEDSLLGMIAAQRAGMKVVGITTTHSASELSGVELALPNFEGVTIDSAAQLLEG